MAEDPAFLFYPGDYLRDTQCLSELSQVAYDRIMCEHMRNICITQSRLKFLTKKLSDDEKEELRSVLIKTDDGFQIKWVAESILKRKAYSKSRKDNREGKGKKDMSIISNTYVSHMENENIVINNKEKLFEFFVKDQLTIEQATMHFSMKSVDELKLILKSFLSDQHLKKKLNRDPADIWEHFMNTTRIQLQAKRNDNSQTGGQPIDTGLN